MMKKAGVMFVLMLLILQPVVLAEETSEQKGWWSTFLDNFFGERENIAGSATCSGFWQCFWGRENVAGGLL